MLFTILCEHAPFFCLYLPWFCDISLICGCICNGLWARLAFLLVFAMVWEVGFVFLLVFTMLESSGFKKTKKTQ
jgi:hypothetical protein